MVSKGYDEDLRGILRGYDEDLRGILRQLPDQVLRIRWDVGRRGDPSLIVSKPRHHRFWNDRLMKHQLTAAEPVLSGGAERSTIQDLAQNLVTPQLRTATCSVSPIDRPPDACDTPRVRWVLMDIPLDDQAFRDRFWSFVDAEKGEWTGYCDRDGYGIFTMTGPAGERVKFRAHRVAWALANDRQPPAVIRHDCDHPPCCRPQCLLGGTQADNIADRDDPARRSRRQRRQRAAAGQHELPLDLVR